MLEGPHLLVLELERVQQPRAAGLIERALDLALDTRDGLALEAGPVQQLDRRIGDLADTRV